MRLAIVPRNIAPWPELMAWAVSMSKRGWEVRVV